MQSARSPSLRNSEIELPNVPGGVPHPTNLSIPPKSFPFIVLPGPIDGIEGHPFAISRFNVEPRHSSDSKTHRVTSKTCHLDRSKTRTYTTGRRILSSESPLRSVTNKLKVKNVFSAGARACGKTNGFTNVARRAS
ncbi:hypothetical protein EVAR_81151_1 [Eumeta japonica]|uniref:Uncharacterized protein n=1 Tax=Eumeta variegata TaxID=151549 RepID=A0A4C1ULE2_EUMVA|nr:hypothetical protein EVAR_81151_1 [Eumeta japonica]